MCLVLETPLKMWSYVIKTLEIRLLKTAGAAEEKALASAEKKDKFKRRVEKLDGGEPSTGLDLWRDFKIKMMALGQHVIHLVHFFISLKTVSNRNTFGFSLYLYLAEHNIS